MRKTKSDLCRVAVSEMIFQRKRNPETYPCTPLFLIVCNHRNDDSHCNDYIRYSHCNNYNDCKRCSDCNRPSGECLLRYSEGILPTKFFLVARIRFFSLLPLAFLALLHNNGRCKLFQGIRLFESSLISRLHRGISDTLAFSK